MTLLLLPPKYWDYRPEAPRPAMIIYKSFIRLFHVCTRVCSPLLLCLWHWARAWVFTHAKQTWPPSRTLPVLCFGVICFVTVPCFVLVLRQYLMQPRLASNSSEEDDLEFLILLPLPPKGQIPGMCFYVHLSPVLRISQVLSLWLLAVSQYYKQIYSLYLCNYIFVYNHIFQGKLLYPKWYVEGIFISTAFSDISKYSLRRYGSISPELLC